MPLSKITLPRSEGYGLGMGLNQPLIDVIFGKGSLPRRGMIEVGVVRRHYHTKHIPSPPIPS